MREEAKFIRKERHLGVDGDMSWGIKDSLVQGLLLHFQFGRIGRGRAL